MSFYIDWFDEDAQNPEALATKGGGYAGGGGGGAKAPKAAGGAGGYAGGGGGAGGYKGTPGWYTKSGHHHCNAGAGGCQCTDPKKCLGHAGTGSQYCAANPGICVPKAPGTCDAYYAGDVKDCHYCPTGTATGKCAGKGTGASAPQVAAGSKTRPTKAKPVNIKAAANTPTPPTSVTTTTPPPAPDIGGGGGGGGGGLGDIFNSIPGGKQTVLLAGGALILLMVMKK